MFRVVFDHSKNQSLGNTITILRQETTILDENSVVVVLVLGFIKVFLLDLILATLKMRPWVSENSLTRS